MENVRKGKGIEKRNKQGQATTEFEAEMREIIFLNGSLNLVKRFPIYSHGPMR